MMGFALAVIVSAAGMAGKIIGALLLLPAIMEFIDAKRGWKIRYDLPPSYYRDIESPNPTTRKMAKDAAEATLKEARNPHRKRYAFDKRRRHDD